MGAWHFLLSEIAAIRDHWGPLAARKVPALVVLRVVQDPAREGMQKHRITDPTRTTGEIPSLSFISIHTGCLILF